jgi:hypothetical protein
MHLTVENNDAISQAAARPYRNEFYGIQDTAIVDHRVRSDFNDALVLRIQFRGNPASMKADARTQIKIAIPLDMNFTFQTNAAAFITAPKDPMRVSNGA